MRRLVRRHEDRQAEAGEMVQRLIDPDQPPEPLMLHGHVEAGDAKSLGAIADALPGREVAVARELTKLHEECRSGTAAELIAHYEAHPPRGEIVLLVGPAAERIADEGHADTLLLEALMTEKPSQAAALVARATGLDRKRLYARALELKAS